jgi:hypothetical protein
MCFIQQVIPWALTSCYLRWYKCACIIHMHAVFGYMSTHIHAYLRFNTSWLWVYVERMFVKGLLVVNTTSTFPIKPIVSSAMTIFSYTENSAKTHSWIELCRQNQGVHYNYSRKHWHSSFFINNDILSETFMLLLQFWIPISYQQSVLYSRDHSSSKIPASQHSTQLSALFGI